MSTSASLPRPRLSICLPTHHGRAAKLDRALRSIAAQVSDVPAHAFEVCVSDNGSNDATQDVLAVHGATFGPDLIQFRFERNQGFTPNLLKVIELARGDFCWLMGSDDEIETGGIAAVLALLNQNPELSGLTLNRRNIDDANPDDVRTDDPSALPPVGRTTYSDAEHIFSELAMLQDYISTQVVRRERWDAAVAELGPEGIAAGLNFPHLPILGAVIRRDPRWRWVAEPVVRHRIGLSSIQGSFDEGLTAYLILVTTDRARIWRAMFGRGSPIYRLAMHKIWLVQANRSAVLFLKQQPGHNLALDARLIACLTRYFWFLPDFWTQTMPVLLLPHGMVRPLLGLTRRFKALVALL